MTSRPFDGIGPADPLDHETSRSKTLPGDYYYRADVFEAEKERIFYRHWQLVAHVSQLRKTGDFVTARIMDQSVFVIRDPDGHIGGFYNVCQHRAHELLEGHGSTKRRIVCPYHSWTYSLTGELESVFRCKKPAFDRADMSLVSVRVQQRLGFVFVNLDPDAAPLEEVPGDMLDDIEAHVPGWQTMEVAPGLDSKGFPRATLDTNWKVLSENSLENYHVERTHPAYAQMVDLDAYRWKRDGLWIKGWGPIRSLDSEAYQITAGEGSQVAITWRMWPNIAFFVLPGESSFSAVLYHPISPTVTQRSNITLVQPGQTPPAERWAYLWGTIWEEDARICESVQRGLRSKGYRQGRFMVDPGNPSLSEHGPHRFQLNYARAMGLEEAP